MTCTLCLTQTPTKHCPMCELLERVNRMHDDMLVSIIRWDRKYGHNRPQTLQKSVDRVRAEKLKKMQEGSK